MKIGYACVSTHDQDLALQLDALEKIGCEKIYQEKRTGSTKERPQLKKMLDQLRPDDVVIIWKLDRLARSLRDLVDLVTTIQQAGASLSSLNDQIDTTTSHGKFTFHLFAALAEFERDIIRERTNAGLQAARARGRVGGRPKGLTRKAQHTAIIAEKLYREQNLSVKEICEQLSISKSTLSTICVTRASRSIKDRSLLNIRRRDRLHLLTQLAHLSLILLIGRGHHRANK